MPLLSTCDVEGQHFTLLEILVAMAILGILTTGLYQVQQSIQHTWRRTERNMKVRQNARILLNIIEADLKGMVAKDFGEERIVVDANGIGARELAFITNNLRNQSSASTLFEVGYSVNSNQFLRWETGDSDGWKWDFLNSTPEIWAGDTSWGSVKTIVEGVMDFEIVLYKLTDTAPYQALYDANSDSDVLPAFATVKLSLFYPESDSISSQTETLQTFTETFKIGAF